MITELIKFVPWLIFILGFFVYYFFLKNNINFSTHRAIFIAGLFWVFLIQAEGIFLGPYSRMEWGDGGRLFVGYFPWLASEGGDNFLLSFMGGIDRYGVGRIGGEFFSLRLILLEHLPFWLVIVLFRLVVPLVALFGVYFFSTRLLRCQPQLAFSLGALYAVGYDFTATLTFLYGISLAGIPLLLYLLFSGQNNLRSWACLFFFGIAYIGTSDPIYWMPALWITIVLFHTWILPKSKSFAYGGLILFTVFWLINYAETIYAFLLLLPYSARGSTLVSSSSLWSQIDWLMGPIFRYNHPGPLFLIPLIITLSIGIIYKSRISIYAAFTSIILAFSSAVLIHISWDQIGLDFLNTYRWYWEYIALCVVILAVASCSEVFRRVSKGDRLYHFVTATIISLAVAMTGVLKIETLLQTLTRGNLEYLTKIPNLLMPTWQKDFDARVVSLPGLIDVNSIVNYGFETYDGASTLVLSNLYNFWTQVTLDGPKISREELGFGLNSSFISCFKPLDIDLIADINMLRLAGVGYLFSYCPLLSAHLEQIDGPTADRQRSSLKNLLHSPDPVRVYEIKNSLPRAWWANRVVYQPEIDNGVVFTEKFKSYVLSGAAIVNSLDLISHELNSIKVPVEMRRKKNSIMVLTYGQGGVLLLNQSWLPWWSAETNTGKVLKPYKANLIHMALLIPDGTDSIVLRYQRPLFFNSLKNFFCQLISRSENCLF
jgi:hypothetical protein